MEERVKKIIDAIPEKMFFHPSFEAPSRNGLLVNVAISDGKTTLNREQEFQIFRKYNYLKYRIIKLTVGFDVKEETPSPKPSPPVKMERLGEKSIFELETLISRMNETRNFIFQANTRLVFKPVGRYFSYESFDRDEFVSNAYIHLMKSIDCFDYRIGFKFSTYCMRVLQMNLLRDMEKLKKVQSYLDFSDQISSVSQRDEECSVQENDEYNAEMVRKVFDKIRMSVPNPEKKIEVLKAYYGIGSSKMFLSEIGEKMNLSKERIRQIKMRAMAALGDLVYEP